MAYDVIVVGARCAGSPLAMLLARQGYRVLAVDRAAFPSDTLCTHSIQTRGVVCLKRWGLLDELLATGVPQLREYWFNFGVAAWRARPPEIEGEGRCISPRRAVLDDLLVQAARRAGAEVRERFVVDDVLIEDGKAVGIRGHDVGSRATAIERARMIIGADGMNSRVARAVRARRYEARPTLSCAWYTYFEEVEGNAEAIEVHVMNGEAVATYATHAGARLVCVQRKAAMFDRLRRDPEAAFWDTLSRADGLADRLRAGKRVARFHGVGNSPNYFRQSWGEGWALVGDAGYHKDPTLAQGISDAFRDAESLAVALDEGLSGRREMAEALAGYQRARDAASAAMFNLVCELAPFDPPAEPTRMVMEALAGNERQRSRFAGVLTGAVRAEDFYSEENIGAILAG